MANLRDLAQSLGLSITTVSRALDGYADVAEATRERVQIAAAAAGYRPNASARRLRKQKAELVAVPLPMTAGRIGTPHLLELLSGCAERLAEKQLNLMIAPVPKGESEIDLCRRLVDGRRVDAVLLVRTRRQDERVAFLQSRGLPFVTDGRTENPVPHAWLDGDGFDGFRRATERLIRAGHRRIGHVAGDQDFFFAHARAEGWRSAMRAAGLACDLMEIGELSEQGGFDAATRLLARAAPPTALLCTTDEMALGTLGALHAAGARAAVIGHDNLPAGAFAHPPLSTMAMAGAETGRQMAELLLRVMAGEPAETLHQLNPVVFVDRRSHHHPGTDGEAPADNRI